MDEKDKTILNLCNIVIKGAQPTHIQSKGYIFKVCPFCGEYVNSTEFNKNIDPMTKIPHVDWCGYSVAKDILAKLNNRLSREG